MSILNRLNEQMSKNVQDKSTQKSVDLDHYKHLLENRERFEIIFHNADASGNLIQIDANETKLILPLNKLSVTDLFVTKSRIPRYLGVRKLEVEVDRLDEENNTVYLKSGRVTPGIVKAVRGELYNEVRRYIDGKNNTPPEEPYTLYGTVERVDRQRQYAYVSILGQPIIGVCRVMHWSPEYLVTLPEGIEDTREPVKFDLVGTIKIDGIQYFRLEAFRHTNNTANNAYKGLLQKGAVIVLKCESTPVGKDYWIGRSDEYGLNIKCYYSDKFKTPIRIGEEYVCTMVIVDDTKHLYTARPIRHLYKETPFNQKDKENNDVLITKEDFMSMVKQKKAKQQANGTGDKVKSTKPQEE